MNNSKEEKKQNVKAYPNPFSDKLNLVFTLPKPAEVKLAIYDYSGRNVYLTDIGTLQKGVSFAMLQKQDSQSSLFKPCILQINGAATRQQRMSWLLP